MATEEDFLGAMGHVLLYDWKKQVDLALVDLICRVEALEARLGSQEAAGSTISDRVLPVCQGKWIGDPGTTGGGK